MSSASDNRQSENGISRRSFLLAGLGAATLAYGGAAARIWHVRSKQPRARVSIFRAESYTTSLERTIRDGLMNYPDVIRRAQAGTVVLKPNLVEYHAERPVNTHAAVVAAAIAAFRSVGARHVIVAEGPGHCRDTELLLQASDIEHALVTERCDFLDLNLDATRPVALAANHTGLGELSFSQTLLGASLIVSMPKMKTHHWAGVTLSMKNLFGTIPGARYGWPKNVLHHSGIENSIIDINLALKPGFAIVDGIEGMQGDGPLRGNGVHAGVLVMGDNPCAVDATATRLMGLYPERVQHLRMMVEHGGTISESRIEQLAEPVQALRRDFRVLDQFAHLKTPSIVSELLL